MKRILVLGAGRVAHPCVDYLLQHTDAALTLVDQDKHNADAVAGGSSRVTTSAFDATQGTKDLLASTKPDLVINLLPAAFMVPVARDCVATRTNMINVSYIKEDMRTLDVPARDAGVLLLCELGLDPGIDHMSAAKTVREIHDRGGKVESFWSCCGAIPAPEANTNPFGYKLSWSPAGLVGASKREARILKNGEVVVYPPGETFRHTSFIEIAGLGWFEQYANADSLPYIHLYDMPEAKNVYRGTIRYIGWSETIRKMLDLGLFEEEELDLTGLTHREFTARLAGATSCESAEAALCRVLKLEPYSSILHKLAWLGLLDDTPLPFARGSARSVVADLYLKKLVFEPGEQDLVVMEHRYEASFADGRRKRFVSTLVDRGIKGGDTSIARTTGLPPAIGARLFLEGKLPFTGVHAPVLPEVYEPSLAELERLGVLFQEREEILA
ncbi:saccharopine dehydrogenase C-terminal domain-containing protein [Aminiphilus sp.]|uniref:saccharopine dehydrogenase C-terminal domain-containing protein n=1 Tax=Aminiphilus sp. TaxID=1872488 RepID=UPI00262467D7|nr:saccharopine dehydrogenase C-terminal domain-containing protein [Aminiphilus sp.]